MNNVPHHIETSQLIYRVNCLSVFDHLVGLAIKGLSPNLYIDELQQQHKRSHSEKIPTLSFLLAPNVKVIFAVFGCSINMVSKSPKRLAYDQVSSFAQTVIVLLKDDVKCSSLLKSLI